MKYYPAYLNLRGRPCTVLGGGEDAEHNAISLLEAGADVTVISTTLTPKLLELSNSGKITHLQKNYEEQDLCSSFLVIAATDSHEANSSAARVCKKRHVLVHADRPLDESSFIIPAVVDRGELLISVFAGGAGPELAEKIQKDLDKQYGPEYDCYLSRLMALHKRMLEEVPDENARREIFQAIAESDVIDLLRQGRMHEAEFRMAEIAGLKHRS